MIYLWLIGALFLGWSLGRNNLSNLFGTAVGTRMIPLRSAAILAIVFICLGAFFSGQATTSNVLKLSALTTPTDAFIVCLSAALVLELSSRFGMPASMAQTVIGALVGWNWAQTVNVDTILLKKTIGAWIVAPFIAAFIGWGLMHIVRRLLTRYPMSLFQRDALVRIGLVSAGILASYSLGANTLGTITAPWLTVMDIPKNRLVFIVCTAVAAGCLTANRKVIQTVSKGIFPLSPTEAFVVMFGTAITILLFTSQNLREALQTIRFPVFPLVPIPVSATIIGAIVGISLSRGGYGLRFSVLGRIIVSWGIVPTLSGGICYLIMKGIAG